MLSRPPRPINTGIAICYGKCLLQIDRRCDDALPFLRRAARQVPREPETVWADAQTFLAVALASSGEFDEAASVLREFAGTRLRSPASAGALQAHAVLAVTDHWRRGWSLHESRRYSPAVSVDGAESARRWRVADGPAEIALIDEQGLGDAVLMARWIPWLVASCGGTARFYGRAPLRRWIEAAGCEFIERPANSQGRAHAANGGAIAESTVVLSMSLPHIAACESPSHVPAPFAPPVLRAARQRHLAANDARRRVGVCWTSTAANLNKQLRFSPEQFSAVWAPLEGVEFVNLTHDARVSAGAPFAKRRFDDVFETGEVIATLDLVVTVDTLVAHLACSLGVPTIVIAPTYYDWRYRWPGEGGSSFYSGMSVIRQRTGDDVSVLSRVRGRLEEMLGRSAAASAGPEIENRGAGIEARRMIAPVPESGSPA